MGNVSRLDQLRPLQFHMRCYTGDVLANTQDLYNRFLKATCIQVRSTAALPQWPTKKRVPAILLPPLSVVDTQACLVCLFYIAVPYSPRFIYCSVSFTLSSMKKKICFPEKLSFYVITMQRNKTEQQQQQKKKGAPTQTPTQHGQICEHAMKGSQTPRATGLTTCKGKSVEKKN